MPITLVCKSNPNTEIGPQADWKQACFYFNFFKQSLYRKKFKDIYFRLSLNQQFRHFALYLDSDTTDDVGLELHEK
jgi:hypothetical protein